MQSEAIRDQARFLQRAIWVTLLEARHALALLSYLRVFKSSEHTLATIAICSEKVDL